MLRIVLTSEFKANYRSRVKKNPRAKKLFIEALQNFRVDRKSPELRDHALKGRMNGERAFYVDNDLRVVYILRDNEAVLLDIGSHEEVYIR